MPFKDDEKTQLITYETVLYTAMMKINELSTIIYSDTESHAQTNLRNFVSAITTFENLCTRYLDKSYYDSRNLLINKYRQKYNEYISSCKINGRNPGDQSATVLEHYNLRYALLIKQLDRRGALTTKSFVELD